MNPSLDERLERALVVTTEEFCLCYYYRAMHIPLGRSTSVSQIENTRIFL